jgi:hypothetical protein
LLSASEHSFNFILFLLRNQESSWRKCNISRDGVPGWMGGGLYRVGPWSPAIDALLAIFANVKNARPMFVGGHCGD